MSNHELAALRDEIRAYEAMEDELLEHHKGKYVLIKDGQLIDTFDTFDAAARRALDKFGRGPYLIRQVGADHAMPMPSSVAFRPVHHVSR